MMAELLTASAPGARQLRLRRAIKFNGKIMAIARRNLSMKMKPGAGRCSNISIALYVYNCLSLIWSRSDLWLFSTIWIAQSQALAHNKCDALPKVSMIKKRRANKRIFLLANLGRNTYSIHVLSAFDSERITPNFKNDSRSRFTMLHAKRWYHLPGLFYTWYIQH